MREIKIADLERELSRLCREANQILPPDILQGLENAYQREESPIGREVLGRILENAAIAPKVGLPLCQDCGVAVVFLEMGCEACFDGNPIEAITRGVARGYREAYLRKSMVSHPFTKRTNTGDNTPPIIHTEIVPGDRLRVILVPKGAGAENMSQVFMLNPGAGREAISKVVTDLVAQASGKACPPLIIGLGIGGDFEMAAYLAKKALLRPLESPHPDPEAASLEEEILNAVNRLGIGPLGFGGTSTALAVKLEVAACHMASLPVGVNLQCHSARHAEVTL